jgi:hypothetical protein
MAKLLDIGGVVPFDPHNDPSSVGSRWKKWLSDFDIYILASGIKDDGQKRALLLHLGGPDLRELFETLDSTGNSFEEAREALTKYLTPKVNLIFERYSFFKAEQLNRGHFCHPIT